MKCTINKFNIFNVFVIANLLLISITTSFAANLSSVSSGRWSQGSTWPASASSIRTGTITTSTTSATIIGTGTAFNTELSVGSIIKTIKGVVIGTVSSIPNATTLVLTKKAASTNIGTAYHYQAPGVSDNVYITSTYTVTVDIINAQCASLLIGGRTNNSSGILTFSTTGSPKLTVTGFVTVGGTGSTNGDRSGVINFVPGSTLDAKRVILTQSTEGNNNDNPGTITMTAGSLLRTGSLWVGEGLATWTPGGIVELYAKNTLPATVITTFNILSVTGGRTTLSAPIEITGRLNLIKGIINTTSTNILTLKNGATTSIGNSSSYINGPMNYDMAEASTKILNFPIGKGTDWRPVVITVTHSNGVSYTYHAELFNASASALDYSLPVAKVNMVSTEHYWDIDRHITGASSLLVPSEGLIGNAGIQLFYGANDGITNPDNLTICKSDSESWIDIGGKGATATSGSISSALSFNSFSRFTLGNKISAVNLLPLVDLKVSPNPSKGISQIQYSGDNSDIQSFEVYNSMGRRVYNSSGINQTTIDLSDMTDGVYTVYVYVNSQVIIQKIVLRK